MQQGAPQVLEKNVDAKKLVESHLKQVCDAFKIHVVRQVADPLLSFLTKVTAFMSVRAASGGDRKLGQESFAQARRVRELVQKLEEGVDGILPPITAKMALYLENEVTQNVLFKPIRVRWLVVSWG